MADLVRRYGRFKSNQLKYGLDTQADVLLGLVVDFENNGYFTGRNEATRLQNFTLERGRLHWIKPDGKGFEEEIVGRFSATVADPDQIYNPYNPASPLYETLDVNRMLQLSVRTPSGSRYKLFTGTLTDLTFTDGVIPQATFSASDGWDYLRSRTEDIQIPVQALVNAFRAAVRTEMTSFLVRSRISTNLPSDLLPESIMTALVGRPKSFESRLTSSEFALPP